MIASLSGEVAAVLDGAIELDVGGVGYHVLLPASLAASLRRGEQTRILTHLVVREDSMTLFGFGTADQRELFTKLMQVSGVGPKLALAVLSSMSTDALRKAILGQDIDRLIEVPGVGKKNAQRIVMELKEKIGFADTSAITSSSKIAEVRDALVGLGYTPSELRGVLDSMNDDDAPVEELLKTALKELSRV